MYNGTYSYTDVMRFAIQTKYSLLKYTYSQMQDVIGNGGALIRPLFYEFDSDKDAYYDINQNFMIGDSIKIAFVTNATDTKQSSFYFPAGTWCELMGRAACVTGPKHMMMDTNDVMMNLMYVRSGYIVPYHSLAYGGKVTELATLETMPMDIIINPDVTTATAPMKWTAMNNLHLIFDNQAVASADVKSNTYQFSAKDNGLANTAMITLTANGANGSGVQSCAGAFTAAEQLDRIVI
jgi:hypothetical protein